MSHLFRALGGDFKVNYNAALEAGGVVVGEEVKINIEIEAIQK